jgi:hypothetical protein
MSRMYYVSRCGGAHASPDSVPAASHLVRLALLTRTGCLTFVVAPGTIAATLADIFKPALATNRPFQLLVVIVAWWALTFINLRALETYSWISATFLVVGMLPPTGQRSWARPT